MNTDILIDFMKRLVKNAASKKVFLILDNLKVHHAKVVKAWLADLVDPSTLAPQADAPTGRQFHWPGKPGFNWLNKFIACCFCEKSRLLPSRISRFANALARSPA